MDKELSCSRSSFSNLYSLLMRTYPTSTILENPIFRMVRTDSVCPPGLCLRTFSPDKTQPPLNLSLPDLTSVKTRT